MIEVTRFEEIVLITILHLEHNAYGIHINKKINETTGRDWNFGTLYRMLDQLVRKGLLERNAGQTMQEKGGRKKTYYSVTAEGYKSLQDSYELQQTLWSSKTKLAVDKGSTI